VSEPDGDQDGLAYDYAMDLPINRVAAFFLAEDEDGVSLMYQTWNANPTMRKAAAEDQELSNVTAIKAIHEGRKRAVDEGAEVDVRVPADERPEPWLR
jgi:hypothetical protein